MVRVTVNLPEAAAGRARDQAPHARRRRHRSAYRRLSLQRPPAAHPLSRNAPRRSTSTASTPATSAPARRRDEQFATICEVARDHGKPVRIGVNGGSLNQELVVAKMQENTDRDLGPDVRRDHQRVHGALGGAIHRAGARVRPAKDQIIISCKTSRPRDLIARLSRARAPDRSAAAPRTDRSRHGHEGAGLVRVRDGRAPQRRNRRHHSRVADAAARRRSPRGGLCRVRAAAGARPARVLAERHRLSRLRPHHEQHVPGARRTDAGLHPRADARMEDAGPRRGGDDPRGHGLRRQRSRRIEGRQHRDQPARDRRSRRTVPSTSTASTTRRCAARTTSWRRRSASSSTTTSTPSIRGKSADP